MPDDIKFLVLIISFWIVNEALILATFSLLAKIIMVSSSTILIGTKELQVLTATVMIGVQIITGSMPPSA